MFLFETKLVFDLMKYKSKSQYNKHTTDLFCKLFF